MWFKFAAVALIFFGEAFSIAAELHASRRALQDPGSFVTIFGPMFLLITLGGALLVAGYMLGYLHMKNIWIIAAVSIGSIVVVEPILAWTLFHQIPTTGALIGLVLGVLGVLFALLVP